MITTASDATGAHRAGRAGRAARRRGGRRPRRGRHRAAGRRRARCDNPLGLPAAAAAAGRGAEPPAHRSSITDRLAGADRGAGATPGWCPPTLVVGIGSARGVPAAAVDRRAAPAARPSTGSTCGPCAAYASVDLKADEAGHPRRDRAGPAAHLPGRRAGRGRRAEPERGGARRGRHARASPRPPRCTPPPSWPAARPSSWSSRRSRATT